MPKNLLQDMVKIKRTRTRVEKPVKAEIAEFYPGAILPVKMTIKNSICPLVRSFYFCYFLFFAISFYFLKRQLQ